MLQLGELPPREATTRERCHAGRAPIPGGVGYRLPDQEILDIWHLDLELNAQGLAYWLEAQDPG